VSFCYYACVLQIILDDDDDDDDDEAT